MLAFFWQSSAFLTEKGPRLALIHINDDTEVICRMHLIGSAVGLTWVLAQELTAFLTAGCNMNTAAKT
jgi:hypothetical protein